MVAWGWGVDQEGVQGNFLEKENVLYLNWDIKLARVYSFVKAHQIVLIRSVHVTVCKLYHDWTSLTVQWLRLHTPYARGPGFDPWSGN